MKLGKLLGGLLVALVLGGGASPLTAAASDPIKIGGNFELTGAISSYGTSMANGVALAIEQLNEKGERSYEFVNVDNKSDKTEAVSVAQKLVDAGVVAIIGAAASGNAIATIPTTNEAGVLTIFPAATADGLTLDNNGKVYENIFRVGFADSYQGKVDAVVAKTNLKASKAVILVDQGNDYSQGLAEAFKTEFTANGGEVVAEEAYTTGDTDFNAVLSNIASLDFDVLYVPGYYTEAGLIIKQARELAIAQPILGGDGFDSKTLEELAGAANLTDVYYTNHFSSISEEEDVKAFVTAYEAKYKATPDTFAALAYDAMMLVDQVVADGATDAASIMKAVAQVKDFDGVTGTFSFDEAHNPIKTALLIHYDGGKVSEVTPVSAD